MTKQPHLDHRAINHFYGSKRHYIVLLLMSFVLVCVCAALFRELNNLRKSRFADAQVQYSMNYSAFLGQGGDAPVLQFIDPEQGEIRYRVEDEPLKGKIREISSYWENIPIRYQIDLKGDVYALELYTLGGTLTSGLILLFLIVGLIFALYRLSPRPYWYWTHAERRFKRVSRHCICMEVRVKQIHEVELRHRRAHRVCYLSGSVYFYQQNRLINVQSPHVLVEPQFRMSYPIMKVYFNPKNLDQYEVDLLDFLKNNASSLHGFDDPHVQSIDSHRTYAS